MNTRAKVIAFQWVQNKGFIPALESIRTKISFYDEENFIPNIDVNIQQIKSDISYLITFFDTGIVSQQRLDKLSEAVKVLIENKNTLSKHEKHLLLLLTIEQEIYKLK
jgi:hypothetical protein